MRQIISLQQWNDTPSNVQGFITNWKIRKGYPQESPLPTLGQCLELLLAVSYTYYHDYSDGRFFNNILVLDEAILAWDGDELIDTLYYEIVRILKRRFARTFNSPT